MRGPLGGEWLWRFQRRKARLVALGAAWVSRQVATIGSSASCARRSAEALILVPCTRPFLVRVRLFSGAAPPGGRVGSLKSQKWGKHCHARFGYSSRSCGSLIPTSPIGTKLEHYSILLHITRLICTRARLNKHETRMQPISRSNLHLPFVSNYFPVTRRILVHGNFSANNE
ncbi:unnamed protein product, partial [Trichogramma brassicae]